MQEIQVTQNNPEKSNKVGEFVCFDFKTHYKSTITKTVGHWYKNEYTEGWNRIKRAKISSYLP